MLAAFPFPLPQGSQVFVEGQLRALTAAGAEATLFCYGSGVGPAAPDLRLRRLPRGLSPRGLRAGPSPGKPAADAALAGLLAREQRRRRFDAVLAHNGEAALAAFCARALAPVPVVYVAHTLLARELDAYLPAGFAAPARQAGILCDRAIARRADAVIALCEAAAGQLSPHARGPVAVIPPGLEPAAPPGAEEIERACRRAGVARGRFALYAGNLDRYQDLDVLAAVAEHAPELPLVVATHGARRLEAHSLRSRRVSPREARALGFGCAAAVLPRRRAGGYPIKLLNYMEAGCAIVAREGIADGLRHGHSAWLLPSDAGPAEFAVALRALLSDRARAHSLGRGARAALEERHAWPALAERTLAFLEGVRH